LYIGPKKNTYEKNAKKMVIKSPNDQCLYSDFTPTPNPTIFWIIMCNPNAMNTKKNIIIKLVRPKVASNVFVPQLQNLLQKRLQKLLLIILRVL
jgi:hypothetical protein